MKLKNLLGLMVAGALVFASCKKDDNNNGGGGNNNTGTVASLVCADATPVGGPAINGVPADFTVLVPYTGGVAAPYAAGSAISSTGVTGLTATLLAGDLLQGDGELEYQISGTPTSVGIAKFAISFGGKSCELSVTVNENIPPSVTTLNCAGATIIGQAVAGNAFSSTATVPYTGGNGGYYPTGSPIASTGVTGLNATLVQGILANGNGNLVLNIAGTPASVGTAVFPISIGGQSCSISVNVSAAPAHIGKWYYDKAYDSAICCLNRLRNGLPLELYTDSSGESYNSNGNLVHYLDLKANNSFTELFFNNTTYNGNYVRNADSLRLNYTSIQYTQRNKVTLENATDMNFYFPRNSYSIGSQYSIVDINGTPDTLLWRYSYIMKKN